MFFENAQIFWMPGRLGRPLLILLWVFVAWLFVRVEQLGREHKKFTLGSLFGPRLVFPDELFVLILVLVWGINFSISYTQSSVSTQPALQYGAMFVGYLLLRGIFAHTSKKDILDFLDALIVVNTLANILYILHSGFHLPIYLSENYQETYLAGALIIRTFWVAPKFNSLAVVSILSKSQWNVKTIATLLLTLAGYYFTYTRSFIIGVSLLFILSQVFLAIKNRKNVKRVLITISVFTLAGVAGFNILNRYYPQSLNFFSQRFNQLSSSGIYGEGSSFVIRMNYLEETFQMVEQVNPILGIGFIDPETSARSAYATNHTADNLFIGVVYRYGMIGVICFLGLLGLGAWRALRRYFISFEPDAWIWLACSLWIIGLAFESLISWTLLDPRNFALALWMFALVESKSARRKITVSARPNLVLAGIAGR